MGAILYQIVKKLSRLFVSIISIYCYLFIPLLNGNNSLNPYCVSLIVALAFWTNDNSCWHFLKELYAVIGAQKNFDRLSSKREYIKKQLSEVLYKMFLKIFSKFTGKHLCRSPFFNKTLLKKRLRYRHFPLNFSKFSRTPFLQNTSWFFVSLLLY